jgi:hypothetical protein
MQFAARALGAAEPSIGVAIGVVGGFGNGCERFSGCRGDESIRVPGSQLKEYKLRNISIRKGE